MNKPLSEKTVNRIFHVFLFLTILGTLSMVVFVAIAMMFEKPTALESLVASWAFNVGVFSELGILAELVGIAAITFLEKIISEVTTDVGGW